MRNAINGWSSARGNVTGGSEAGQHAKKSKLTVCFPFRDGTKMQSKRTVTSSHRPFGRRPSRMVRARYWHVSIDHCCRSIQSGKIQCRMRILKFDAAEAGPGLDFRWKIRRGIRQNLRLSPLRTPEVRVRARGSATALRRSPRFETDYVLGTLMA